MYSKRVYRFCFRQELNEQKFNTYIFPITCIFDYLFVGKFLFVTFALVRYLLNQGHFRVTDTGEQ